MISAKICTINWPQHCCWPSCKKDPKYIESEVELEARHGYVQNIIIGSQALVIHMIGISKDLHQYYCQGCVPLVYASLKPMLNIDLWSFT